MRTKEVNWTFKLGELNTSCAKNEMIGLFNVGLVTPGTYSRQERFSMNDMSKWRAREICILLLYTSCTMNSQNKSILLPLSPSDYS